MGTLLLAVALAAGARAEPPPLPPGLDREVVTGIDRIYRMDFDGADRRALATPDHWGFHRLAKRFVSSPFRDGGHPGAIPPPY